MSGTTACSEKGNRDQSTPVYALSLPSGGLLPQYSILIYFRPRLHFLGLERGWRCTLGGFGWCVKSGGACAHESLGHPYTARVSI